MSAFEHTENWLYIPFYMSIFRLVLKTNLKASNNMICTLCFNWKHPSLLFLIKNEHSDIVKPTIQFLKNGKLT